MTDTAKQAPGQDASGALVMRQVEDWTLFEGDSATWVRDLDLANKAEVKVPRHIRVTIQAAITQKALVEIGVVGDYANGTPGYRKETETTVSGKGKAETTTVYYLNQEGALLILTRLRAPKAIEVTKAVVTVFAKVMREAGSDPGGFAAFRPVAGAAVGEPVIVDVNTGAPLGRVSDLNKLLDRMADMEARQHARDERQDSFLREFLTATERARAEDRALIARLLPAAPPIPQVPIAPVPPMPAATPKGPPPPRQSYAPLGARWLLPSEFAARLSAELSRAISAEAVGRELVRAFGDRPDVYQWDVMTVRGRDVQVRRWTPDAWEFLLGAFPRRETHAVRAAGAQAVLRAILDETQH